MIALKALTSVTFRHLNVDEIINLAVKNDLNAIEWGSDVHIPVGDFKKAEEVKLKCQQNNISITSYGSYFRGLTNDFDIVLNTAVALGVKVIRVWAGDKTIENYSEKEFINLVKVFQNCADLAEKENVIIAFEYHRGTLTQTKESAYKLINAINKENVACYWQPNPDVTFDEQIEEIKLLAPFIINMHVFAWTKGNERHLLSTAISNWKQYLKTIYKKGVSVNLILEFVLDDKINNFELDCKALDELINFTEKPVTKTLAVYMSNMDRLFEIYDDKTRAEIENNFLIYNEIITTKTINNHLAVLKKAEVIFSTWGMISFSEDEIKEYLPNLKSVFYAAGSVQKFARPFLHCDVKVFSAWAANAIPVVEYTIAQIVLASKGFYQSSYLYKTKGRETSKNYAFLGSGNYNIKVGVLGVGMIGKMVCERLQNYDIEVLAYDPFASDEVLDQIGAKRASLEEIFESCQVISNHIANLPSTVGLLNYKHFTLMKDNSTFINTGRGAQVVEADLIKALNDNLTRTAVLDVMIDENNHQRNAFEDLDNVFLTPHIAGSSGNEVARMGKYMLVEAINWLENKECPYQVSLKMLETMA
ncbi:MAG: NAD(P)-dependent oxidoreductase [Clostridia bacterium]